MSQGTIRKAEKSSTATPQKPERSEVGNGSQSQNPLPETVKRLPNEKTTEVEVNSEVYGPVQTLPAGTKLKRSVFSSLFPTMPNNPGDVLENSLHMTGQINEIILYRGMIIDGWERYIRLIKLGMPIRVIEYIGDDPAALVMALNYYRKSMTNGQRLFIPARLATLKPGEQAEAKGKGANLPITLEQAAEMSGHSVRTVKKAKKILDSKHSGLIAAVESDKISVDMACNLIGKNEKKIKKVLNSDNPKNTFAELFPKKEKSDGNGSPEPAPETSDDDSNAPMQPVKTAQKSGEKPADEVSNANPSIVEARSDAAPSNSDVVEQISGDRVAALLAQVRKSREDFSKDELTIFADGLHQFLVDIDYLEPEESGDETEPESEEGGYAAGDTSDDDDESLYDTSDMLGENKEFTTED